MPHFKGLNLATAATATLLIGSIALAQDSSMSSEEIRSAWIGKTVTGTIAAGPFAGKDIDLLMKPDGTATVSGATSDTGTWRLPGQGYCATWAKIRAGQERCFTVVRKGTDTLVLNPDGSVSTAIKSVR